MTQDLNRITVRSLIGTADVADAHDIAGQLLGGALLYRFISEPTRWSADWSLTPPPDDAFEVRWFNDRGELRWVRGGDEGGDDGGDDGGEDHARGGRVAVLLIGDHTEISTSSSTASALVEVGSERRDVEVVERHYRCWGTTEQVRTVDTAGFIATLFESRIGSLDLPVEQNPVGGAPVEIVAWELLDQDPEGNVRVVDEVLRAIRPVPCDHEEEET